MMKNWWLLALCGILNAFVSVLYLLMQDRNESMSMHVWKSMGQYSGDLMLAGGTCLIACGVSRFAKSTCWLLVTHGLAVGALGLILSGLFPVRSLKFRTVALLFVLMALSLGIHQLLAARKPRLRGHIMLEWILGSAGAFSIAFAAAFLALGFSWVKIDLWSYYRTLADYMWWKADFLWFAFYFAFSAICMLAMGFGLRSLGTKASGVGPRATTHPA